jgi:Transglutaminase-like superfamily
VGVAFGGSAEIDYAVAGPLTELGAVSWTTVPADPVEVCRPVHELVIQPRDARKLGLAEERFAENQVRPAARLMEILAGLDPAPVRVPRPPERRVIGTCRHFAVLACALLRAQGTAARVRCGFATYFQPGQGVDHWIVEYVLDGRWVRLDPELLGASVVDTAEDLRPGQFLSGGEAWIAYRQGRIDASTFGVYGTDNWGAAEIRGNAVKDLAALNKVEMLPWDEWGRMTASYQGRTGGEYDELIDTVAAVCAADEPAAVAALYASEDLAVPDQLVR